MFKKAKNHEEDGHLIYSTANGGNFEGTLQIYYDEKRSMCKFMPPLEYQVNVKMCGSEKVKSLIKTTEERTVLVGHDEALIAFGNNWIESQFENSDPSCALSYEVSFENGDEHNFNKFVKFNETGAIHVDHAAFLKNHPNLKVKSQKFMVKAISEGL